MPVVLLFTSVHAPVRDGPHAASVVADGPDEPPALVPVCRDQRPIRQLPARTEAGRLPRDEDPRGGHAKSTHKTCEPLETVYRSRPQVATTAADQLSSPSRRATAAASVRLPTPSLARMLDTC